MSAYAGYILEVFCTLAAVCVLAAIVLWGARRVGVGRPTGPIELRGQLALDARRAIYLVKVGELIYVVGVSEAGMTKLGELPASGVPAGDPPAAASFPGVLARVWKRGERP